MAAGHQLKRVFAHNTAPTTSSFSEKKAQAAHASAQAKQIGPKRSGQARDSRNVVEDKISLHFKEKIRLGLWSTIGHGSATLDSTLQRRIRRRATWLRLANEITSPLVPLSLSPRGEPDLKWAKGGRRESAVLPLFRRPRQHVWGFSTSALFVSEFPCATLASQNPSECPFGFQSKQRTKLIRGTMVPRLWVRIVFGELQQHWFTAQENGCIDKWCVCKQGRV